MELIAFTTFADVRAVIGLTQEELPDSDLQLETYIFGLEGALDAISPNLEADYLAASAATASASETVTEKALYRATRLFAVAQVGLAVAYSLPMRSQKSITDGKAGLARFADSPYRDTLANLQALLAAAQTNLVSVYSASVGGSLASTIPSFMRAVSPTVDPVKG